MKRDLLKLSLLVLVLSFGSMLKAQLPASIAPLAPIPQPEIKKEVKEVKHKAHKKVDKKK